MSDGDPHSTLDSLLRRMRSNSDFPALSGTISEINKIASSESESPGMLAKVILQDFALTNKILKLVNTVTYGQFGRISTISKAVVILGFDTVRNIAMTLILLEFLQNKAQAEELKDEVIASYFAGIMAAELSGATRPGEAEEAMICAMFQNLGRLLATFYFFEESQKVIRLRADEGIDEELASIRVLGISYSRLGGGVAENWNFPSRLVAGMKKLASGKVKKPHSELDRLRVTVNLANELCMVSAITDGKEKSAELKKLCLRYGAATHISEKMLANALENGLNELSLRAGFLGIILGKSSLLTRIRNWSEADPTSVKVITADERSMEGVELLDTATPDASYETPLKVDPETILTAGIQDVTNTLVEDYNLNDVLMMVLETIYRSLGFKHALVFIRDNKQNAMLAKLGFGEQIDAVIPLLKFSLNFVPDVFHLAIEKGVDIVIEDVNAVTISDKIPGWYSEIMDVQCFILLPIMVNKKAIGLIYADMQEANTLQISARQLSLLRTLRNQAVLAIKQKLP